MEVCKESPQLEHSSVIIPLFSKLHTSLMYSINWTESFLCAELAHTHTRTQTLYLPSHTLFLSPSFSLFPLSFGFPGPSKSNIWVSLYLVEQDLQDIVGRMCELEQFTLWESPIHNHTHTHIHTAYAHSLRTLSLSVPFDLIPRYGLRGRHVSEYSCSMM